MPLDAVVHSALFEDFAEALANGDVGFRLSAVDEFRQRVAARTAFESASSRHDGRRVERRTASGGSGGRRRSVAGGSSRSSGRSSGRSGSLVRSPGCESMANNVTYR